MKKEKMKRNKNTSNKINQKTKNTLKSRNFHKIMFIKRKCTIQKKMKKARK